MYAALAGFPGPLFKAEVSSEIFFPITISNTAGLVSASFFLKLGQITRVSECFVVIRLIWMHLMMPSSALLTSFYWVTLARRT